MLRVLLGLGIAVASAYGACQDTFRAGLSELQGGQVDAALVDLQVAVQCDPKMTEAYLAIGQAYERKGDETEALRSYTRALDLDPQNAVALHGAASIYLRNDNNDKALPLLETLAGLVPDDPQVHVDLGASYAATGRLNEAEPEFQAARKLKADNASALLGLGNLYQKMGKSAEAAVLLQQAVQLSPKAFEPHFVLGSVYNSEGKYAEAAKELQVARKLGGEQSAEVYYQLARAYQNLGQDEARREALAQFARIRENEKKQKENRDAITALTAKASSLLDAGDLQGAVARLEEAKRLGKPDHSLLFRLAGLQYDLHQYEAARENIRRAIEMAPTVWLYRFLLGLIETDSNRLPDARTSLGLAIRLNPSAAEAYNALGRVLLKERDWPAAVSNFQQAVSLKPAEPDFRANLEVAQRAAQTAKQ